MVLPDRRLFPFRVGLGQNTGIRDFKHSLKLHRTLPPLRAHFPLPLLSSPLMSSQPSELHTRPISSRGNRGKYGCVNLGVGQVSTWSKPTVNARTQAVSKLDVRHGCLVSLDKPPWTLGESFCAICWSLRSFPHLQLSVPEASQELKTPTLLRTAVFQTLGVFLSSIIWQMTPWGRILSLFSNAQFYC